MSEPHILLRTGAGGSGAGGTVTASGAGFVPVRFVRP